MDGGTGNVGTKGKDRRRGNSKLLDQQRREEGKRGKKDGMW